LKRINTDKQLNDTKYTIIILPVIILTSTVLHLPLLADYTVTGWPRVNWMDIVKRNLKSMGISWEEAGELAADRTEWRQRVAQCIYDAG